MSVFGVYVCVWWGRIRTGILLMVKCIVGASMLWGNILMYSNMQHN